MALVINDRVKETTTTTGTGAVSLAGAVTGFETFAAGIGNSNTVYYCIAHQDQAEFEVGLGTLDGDSSDLTRTTVISSSNSDSAVNFSSGTKDVFCTIPASKMVFEDANDSVASITSLKNTSLVIGRDADNDIDFATDNNIIFRAGGADQVKIVDGVLQPVTDSDVDLGTTGVRFKNAFVDTITATGEIDGASLDISGNADIDGTLEADAITIGGTSLAATIHATVGAMVSSNTESGLSVTYQASDNTLDFDVIDPTITLTGAVTGSATMTNLGSISIATTSGVANIVTDDIADNAVTTAKIANNSITEAKMADDSVGSAEMKSLSTLLIINSAGATVKTLHGAGA